MSARDDLPPVHLVGVGDIQPDDLRPPGHDVGHRQLIEPQHALDHRALGLVEHPGGHALFDQVGNLLLGRRRVHLLAEAEGLQQHVGRDGQEPDEGRGDLGEDRHRLRHQHGARFRVGQGDALRGELADDEREIGDRADDDQHRENFTVGGDGGKLREPHGEFLGEGRAAERAGHDAHERDADLDGGQEAGRFLGEGEGGLSLGGAPGGERLEAGLAGGNDGDLGHREHPIGEQQDKDDEDFGQVVHGGRYKSEGAR